MDISLTIPEETAKLLQGSGENLSRAMLELAGYDAFRRGRISEFQLQTLLGFETRYELWDFLKASQQEGAESELQAFENEFGNIVPTKIVAKAERSA